MGSSKSSDRNAEMTRTVREVRDALSSDARFFKGDITGINSKCDLIGVGGGRVGECFENETG